MTEVVVFAGKKQSGKSSAGNFVAGFALTQMGRRNPGQGLPTQFTIDDEGQLIVNSSTLNSSGQEIIEHGILDLTRRDYDFVKYAEEYIWPYVRVYNFADLLKDIAVTVFGLEWKQVFGSDDDKNSLTKIKWHDVMPFMDKAVKKDLSGQGKLKEYMTSREFLQFFGTEVCRAIYDDCWIESCFRRIKEDQPALAIICDCRFGNEIDYSLSQGAHVFRLMNTPFESTHKSETEIDKVDPAKFSAIIPAGLSIVEKNQEILDTLYKLGVFQGFVE